MKSAGTLDVLLELKAKGKIGHIGASAHKMEAVQAVLEDDAIEVIQWPFNFIMEEDGLKVLEECRRKDVGFIAMKPFGGGMLDDAGVCIRYLMQFPELAPDPGFEKVEEVEEVVRIAEQAQPLSERDQAVIARLRRELGTRFCRMCNYCMPCEQGVQIPILMRMDSMIKRLPPQKIFSWVANGVETVEKCIECGECETKCPYELPIRELIREGAEKFREYAAKHSKK